MRIFLCAILVAILLLKVYLAIKVEYNQWSFYDLLFPIFVGPLCVLIFSKLASDVLFLIGVTVAVSVSMAVSYLVYVALGIPKVEFDSNTVFLKYSIGFWAYYYPISIVLAFISWSMFMQKYR